jgi:hypothetical protein
MGHTRLAGIDARVSGEEPLELGEDGQEEILAAEVNDDALFDLTDVAIGFDDADVFMDGATGRADFDSSRIHGWVVASIEGGCPETIRTIITTSLGRIKVK